MTGRRIVSAVIGSYRRLVSPLMPRHCRYEPTCSAYAQEAVELHGAVAGSWVAAKRVARCHPWAPGGIDPVPAVTRRP
jgi:uncharacterized protein